jgi:hypothetical protein
MYCALLVALALSPAPQGVALPPPLKIESAQTGYDFGKDDPAAVALWVSVVVPTPDGTILALSRVAGRVPKGVLLLEIAFRPSPTGKTPRPKYGRSGRTFRTQVSGLDAALTEVWVRDQHGRVLLKLPIDPNKKEKK